MKTANLDKIYGWRLSREFEDSTRIAKNPMEAERIRQNPDRSVQTKNVIFVINKLQIFAEIVHFFILRMFAPVPVDSVNICFGARHSTMQRDLDLHWPVHFLNYWKIIFF